MRRRWLSAGMVLLCAVSVAWAQPVPAQGDKGAWMTVGDDTLDAMRGGFDLGGGIMVSFGISRAVMLNGVLVASTSFHVADIARITPAQAASFERQMNGANLVQVGAANSYGTTGASSGPATIVQNSLDNQKIQTQTVIDTTTNGMSMAKGLNTGSTLRDALIQSVRGR